MSTSASTADGAVNISLSPVDLFLHADSVGKGVIILLLLASVASWGVIVEKLLRFRILHQRARSWLDTFRANPSLPELAASLARHPKDPLAKVFRSLINEWKLTHDDDLHLTPSGRESLKERLIRVGQVSTGIELEHLQRGSQILATIGSVAPFVGLFGTVWGIMNAFQGIAATNNTSLAVVAPGIAEALFATALGLAAAIPAVIAYNRIAGDIGAYANRLGTLIGVVEVQLSRQLESGRPLPDSVISVPAAARAATQPAAGARLGTQGA
ncbi:MotA/TolQ/ExbB proton channel family protein [Thauera linaloolentis]|uniref:MotA/TolQ/ExbB proton channel n=1 Tax=Thauera linaloolentis (strain DSM 12138 / JCM 21573 / CCUG 41526 / CIP 105981 / IAM 15112 / NBRC 102519 / 47Lol) TaxID=1123367 RepID=N6ZB82_THAL4|nr:MotA/TolQ/ExbB proton channel family protein [Thauera linaloolentis]ENO89429.1 MotA/TolQ/ExbB proton channel [Thauera linaloolentis 47Lol = DSM 12138]MCM8566934.1 MotA/TolQ/ExbB proton channel family protein [Thauera linaloolentis]